MLKTGGNVSLDWLAKEACYSIKQFRRKFVEQVGINPQYYSRIIRFTQAFNLHNKSPDLDWLSVALETGYYDYQHLAKDYKEFSYHTPVEFSLLESKSPERVLGIANEVYKSRWRDDNLVY
jgi:transcriptional regulator GlxA family with amidase domain